MPRLSSISGNKHGPSGSGSVDNFNAVELGTLNQLHVDEICNTSCPDSKVHVANMGSIWGRQDPGGPHVGPMNFAIWEVLFQRRAFFPKFYDTLEFAFSSVCVWSL